MSPPSYPGPDTIQRHVLDNGLTVLLYENPNSRTVVLDGLLCAGALAEPPGSAGLADFTARLLMRGAADRSFEDIYEALESVGAGLSFGSGRHRTSFSAHCLAEDLDLVLELLSQSLRSPSFPAEQLERLRGEALTGLQIRANNTRQMAGLTFRELAYQDHPYGRPVSGYVETISVITRANVLDFHQAYFGPRGAIVALVGAVDPETALRKLSKVLGDWGNEHQQPMPEVAGMPRPAQLVRRDTVLPDKSQADVVLGLPGPRRSAPDYLDVSLMNTILGVFGMMGRIGQSVREDKGLAYYAYSRLSGGLGPNPWTAAAGVAPQHVERAIEAILDEIRRIQSDLVTDEELADSKAYRTGSLPMSIETNAGIADVITDMEIYDLGLDYLYRYPELINAITPERIRQAARAYLSAEQVAVAVCGPEVS